ncbi:hypothetical protein FACS1894130_02870 [Spirochaetia bacterium]|nr:hypothetical protein FACS1894130_02870 [Spirochaetia bacterium]
MKTIIIMLIPVLFLGCNLKKENAAPGVIFVDKEYAVPSVIVAEEEKENVYVYDYQNKNGTILEETINGNEQIRIRKHEQRFSVYFDSHRHIAYSDPSNVSKQLFELNDGEFVNTLVIAYIVNTATSKKSNWVKIRDDQNRIGWLDMHRQWDIYEDGTGAYLETITTTNNTWTVIKLEQEVAFLHDSLEAQDKPGFDENKILFKLTTGDEYGQLNLHTLAVTDEEDIIDNSAERWIHSPDRWIKIKDDQGRIGWIFGGYVDRMRGGAKYSLPEDIIDIAFGRM